MTTLRPTESTATGSPFESNHADPWARTFVDLPSLNANVTDAIIASISSVRAAAHASSALRTKSILVLGPAGAGKTHLFARLRHKLGPRAVFVLLRPLVGTEMTPRYVLGQIVQQLGYESAEGGLKQLDALVGSTLAHVGGSSVKFPRVFVEEVAALDEPTRSERLDAALEHLLERYQEADETYLARLLRTPFQKGPDQRAALAWLAGRELEEGQMKRLGVTASLPDERIVQALQTLGVFAACGAPLVLVFDQLENLMDAEATGSRVRAYANLVAELFDTLRGAVLVQMALDTEWERAIFPALSAAQRSRLADHTEIMAMPTPEDRRSLVATWVDKLPHRPEPFPWPFGEKRVSAWAMAPGMTPRMLMIACRRALAEGPTGADGSDDDEPADDLSAGLETKRTPTVDDDATSLELSWAVHLDRARSALDEAARDKRGADPARLVGGMAHALALGSDAVLLRTDARLALPILVKATSERRALALLHHMHPASAVKAIDRATEALAEGAVLLVRERSIEIPPTWKKAKSAVEGARSKGAGFLVLERDDTANLLALESFVAAARSRDLEGAEGRPLDATSVLAWVTKTRALATWPVVAALTQESVRGVDAPSGEPHADPPPRVDKSPPPAAKGQGLGTEGALTASLGQLRVASLERLTREVARLRAGTTRADVMTALALMKDRVRWFGSAIVALVDRGGQP